MSRETWITIGSKDEKEHKIAFDRDGSMYINDKKVQIQKKVGLRGWEFFFLVITALSVFAQALHAWLPCFFN